MIGTATIIIVILAFPFLARKFGKKAVAVAGFVLTHHRLFGILSTDADGCHRHGRA